VGVASREHVLAAVHGGFCQLKHGKEAPVQRLKRGDKLIYYSPRASMNDGEVLPAFTAVGEISDDAPYQIEQATDFHPFRRKTSYFKVKEAPIRTLLNDLSFTRERSNWGMMLRRGFFEISEDDYRTIAEALGLK
jgi:EVE domain-containing protein